MKDSFKAWALLAASYLATRMLVSYWLGGGFGLDGETWMDAAVVPLFQAALLGCLARPPGAPPLHQWLKNTLRGQPLFGLLLVADLALLFAGWFTKAPWADLGGRGNLIDHYGAGKAIVLGALFVISAARNARPSGFLALLGIASLGFGLQRLQVWAESGALYAACGALAAAAGWKVHADWSRRSPSAAAAVGWAAAPLLPASLLAALSLPHSVALSKPWAAISMSLVLPALTVLWMGLATLEPAASRPS